MVNIEIFISFIIYLALMMVIGGYFYNKNKNTSDYYLAGRKLNRWVASISAQASDMSGWLLMGLPGYAYLAGLEASWIAIGLALGTYFNWRFIAKPLRIQTEKLGKALTLSQYFENRYNDKKHSIRIISSLFVLVFFVIYTASGFVAGAKLFNQVFEISYHQSLFIAVFIIIGYTFLGGFNAVSWTDLLQGTLMFIAIIMVPLIGWFKVSDPMKTLKEITIHTPDFLTIGVQSTATVAIIVILSNLAWGLGYFGQPHILARFMAIKNPSQVAFSRRVAMIWVCISLLFAIFVGIVGRILFVEDLQDNERVFISMVHQLFNPWMGGIFLAAILAAVMSTADSQLLVASSAITEDLLNMIRKKPLPEKKMMQISRWVVVIIALIGGGIAWNPNNKVLDLVAYAWAGFGATFGPLVILSLYWKKMTRNGALAAILLGGGTVLLWKQLDGGIFDLYEILPGFVAGLAGGLIFSKRKSGD